MSKPRKVYGKVEVRNSLHRIPIGPPKGIQLRDLFDVFEFYIKNLDSNVQDECLNLGPW